MPKRRKKLIEVALPLKKINEQSAREKSIRHGHPSTLHLWWARRPLAACRAVLFAQLVDDPSSDPAFRRLDGSVDEERAGIKRAELFNLIEELVRWENSNNPRVINRARAEIARCVASRKIELGELEKQTVVFGPEEGNAHPDGPLPNDSRYTAWQVNCRMAPPKAVDHFLAEYAPPVLDPFAGGGSIPLEAQRLGLRAHASDLNPVAVLINKALIEIPPKFAGLPPVNPEWRGKSSAEKTLDSVWQGAKGLAEDVRYYGEWMRNEAEKRIGHLYPKVAVTKEMAEGRPDLKPYVGNELTVIAWLWARTVKCPNPACGRRMPMIRSFWLSSKKGKEAWADPILDRERGTVRFAVRHDGKPPEETTNKTMARCLFCNNIMKKGELRKTASEHGMAEIPLAVVAEGERGRVYLESTCVVLPKIEKPAAPEIEQPITDDKRWFSPPQYGLPSFRDLFTPRQLTALTMFGDLVGEARDRVLEDATEAGTLPDDKRPLPKGGIGAHAYSDAVAIYLAFILSKSANYWSSLCAWATPTQKMISTFGRQALPMVWDFAEANPFSDSTGNYYSGVRLASEMIEVTSSGPEGYVAQNDAIGKATYSNEVVVTDPPYYDNIGYADLSDFFYVWLRRSLKEVYPNLLSTMLTPKAEEMIASPYRHSGSKQKASEFFETRLGSAIEQWRKHSHGDYPTAIFYAFKQAETTTAGTASTGWETFLTGVIHNGFSITGTWPMRTELTGNLKKQVAALASSVVLACVPRPEDAPMATRREFLNALKRELPDALRLLQSGSIAPVDLAQAAIGPGMAVFSRFSRVVEADGSPMTVRTALTLINQTLDDVLSEQEGEFDADTRWAVAWFEQYGMQEGPYGTAETLSKAKNTSVQGLVEAGIVKSRSGSVRLLGRDDMPAGWDPGEDKRLTAWEAAQHLIRTLDQAGESGAADLLRQLGGDYGDRSRDLAYRLYSVCERKGWASEALAYNSIVLAWPEISKLAHAAPRTGQLDLFEQE